MKPRYSTVLLALLGGLLATPATGQSAFSARGLGYPLEPIDARARSLGGVALGFPEPEITWANPASVVGLLDPGMIIGYQYDNFSTEATGGALDGSTARFPLVLAAFPAGPRLVLMGGYGSFLDQNWRIERPDSLTLGNDRVPITDLASSEGGVARLRVGAAYRVLDNLGVGLAVDAYTGDVQRVQGRLFESQTTPSCCRTDWSYGGIGLSAGVRYAPMEALSVGASISHGGTLEGEVTAGEGSAVSYDLPLVFRGGATGRIGQATLLALGGSWSGWSSLDDTFVEAGGARDAWSFGGGIEYEGLTLGERPVPLRLGARTGALPFRWDNDEATEFASEQVVTLGGGVVLAGGATRSDVALEFGSRGAESAGLDESFWRFAFSVRVLGR